ncbi:hypothetical protein Fot_12608 [Forsythia ovata]|uniref:Uncharacterized protein n=1 Tax=Forsythia ovata TaxID=205694 RepID=A0ABD1WQW6_9LAMI
MASVDLAHGVSCTLEHLEHAKNVVPMDVPPTICTSVVDVETHAICLAGGRTIFIVPTLQIGHATLQTCAKVFMFERSVHILQLGLLPLRGPYKVRGSCVASTPSEVT